MKITYAPWEEIVIYETIQYQLDEFISKRAIGVPTGGMAPPLLWAKGVVFDRIPIPTNTDIIKEQLKGRIHFAGVGWAHMPEHQSFVEIKETKVKIPIVNVSANTLLSEVAKWVRKHAEGL